MNKEIKNWNSHFSERYTKRIQIPKYMFYLLKHIKKYYCLRKLKIFKWYDIILSLPKNAKVLDVGCGDGIRLRIIEFLRPDLKLYGIDISDKSKFLPDYVNFKIASGDNLPFKNNTFDLVICFHVLEYILNAQDFINEFERVLKKDGMIIIETPYSDSVIFPGESNFFMDPTHYRPFTKRSLQRLFDVNGEIKIIFVKAYRYGKLPIYIYLLFLPFLVFKLGFVRSLLKIFLKKHIIIIGEE